MAVSYIKQSRYRLSPKAKRDLAVLGVTTSVHEVHRMLTESAPVKHLLGDRRYGPLIFKLVDTTVVSVGHILAGVHGEEAEIRCWACLDTGELTVYNPCDVCEGKGCSSCGDGLVQGVIRCTNPGCRHNNQATTTSGRKAYPRRAKKGHR